MYELIELKKTIEELKEKAQILQNKYILDLFKASWKYDSFGKITSKYLFDNIQCITGNNFILFHFGNGIYADISCEELDNNYISKTYLKHYICIMNKFEKDSFKYQIVGIKHDIHLSDEEVENLNCILTMLLNELKKFQ